MEFNPVSRRKYKIRDNGSGGRVKTSKEYVVKHIRNKFMKNFSKEIEEVFPGVDNDSIEQFAKEAFYVLVLGEMPKQIPDSYFLHLHLQPTPSSMRETRTNIKNILERKRLYNNIFSSTTMTVGRRPLNPRSLFSSLKHNTKLRICAVTSFSTDRLLTAWFTDFIHQLHFQLNHVSQERLMQDFTIRIMEDIRP